MVRAAEEGSFRRHLVIYQCQRFIALSLVYVPSGGNLMNAPPGLSPPVLACCSFVFRVSSRSRPSLYRFIDLSLTPPFDA